MKTTISGSVIRNATIICHKNVISAAFYGDKVELFGDGYTIRIDVDNVDQAQEIFNHFDIPWSYKIL